VGTSERSHGFFCNGRGTKNLAVFFGEQTLKINSSFSEFAQMAQQGNLIPVYQEFLADTETPVSAYLLHNFLT